MTSETRFIYAYSEGKRYELLPNAQASMEAAAERWGATFQPIERPGRGNFWCQKMRHFLDVCEGDRALYLDGDMLIRADCPNVFDLVPSYKAGFVPVQQDHRNLLVHSAMGGVPCVQGGFQLYSKHQAQHVFNVMLYKQFERLHWTGMDQDQIQFMISALSADVCWLPAMFDFIFPPSYSKDWIHKALARDCWMYKPMLPRYIVHFAGNREGWERKAGRVKMFDWKLIPELPAQ